MPAALVLFLIFLLKIAQEAYPGRAEFLVAGVGICIRLEMVAVFLGCGWGAAATTLVGQNLGARRPDRASRGTWVMVIFGVSWTSGYATACCVVRSTNG